MTDGTKSYKVPLGKHKDDQKGTKNPYTSMNVIKQDAIDTKGTTYANYEWHTLEWKKKLLEIKHLRRLKKKNEIVHKIPIFCLSFYAKLDTMWLIYKYM